MTVRAHQWDTRIAHAYPPVASEPDRACAGADPEIFFPTTGGTTDEAKAICRACPHRNPCLDWALETQQQFGVWGETSPDERARILRGGA